MLLYYLKGCILLDDGVHLIYNYLIWCLPAQPPDVAWALKRNVPNAVSLPDLRVFLEYLILWKFVVTCH